MEKYRKKLVVIEAEQWKKVTYDRKATKKLGPIYHLSVGYYRHPKIDGQNKCKQCGVVMHNHGWVDSLDGGHIVCPNDWIIAGEMYPCKPGVFEASYEKVGKWEKEAL